MQTTLSLLPEIYLKFNTYMLVFTRISALFSVFVLFRRDFVNVRTLLALASLLSFYVVLLNPSLNINYQFSLQMIIQMLFQFMLGFVTGLIMNLVFEVVNVFGQLITTQIGLGFASLMDPRMGSISYLTRFYMYVIMLLFLMMNGHLFLIKILMDTFTVLPVGQYFMPTDLFSKVLGYSGIIFSGSVLLSITVIVAILLVNIALAVVTRFAPQFNLFSIGISMTLVIGLICIYLTFNIFLDKGSAMLGDGIQYLQHTMFKLK